jgi:C1A family cysteine protease
LTNDEYSKMMSEDVSIGADMKDKYPELNTSSLGQAEIDWVAAGHVTPIQNQLTCGSCWAFAAVSTIESHNSIINN